jgi:hypothetical protein
MTLRPGEQPTHHPEQKCPACQHAISWTTAANKPGSPTPKPGEVSICIFCTAILIFDEQLKLRLPTRDELAEWYHHPEVVLARKKIRDHNAALQ